MNRSILIVLCDFLLLTLLTFSSLDMNQTPRNTAVENTETVATNKAGQASGKQDLGEAMRMALDEERRNRDQLTGELKRTRAVIAEQGQQIENVRAQVQTKEQQAAKLAEEQASLQSQYAAAQTNISALNERLHATTVDNVITKEQRAAMEAEARKQSEKASELEKQLADLKNSNQAMQSDRSALQNQLQMSEASNRSALAQMTQLQEEVDVQRRENSRLAEGVKVLAVKSSELAHEIHENRPLTPNTIFDEMLTNRVAATFSGVRPGIFGADSTKARTAQIILVTDETNTVALCHVTDTPLTLWNPGTQWEQLAGALAHGSATVPIASISFAMLDPRVTFIPLPEAQAKALGCKVYHLAKNPYVFQDAVVVGTRGEYYGQCKFQIDVSTPQYLKMDHNSLKGLFGKFNPSAGDLVLSDTGELLGVMANNNYCAMLRDFNAIASFRFGPDSRHQQTAKTLAGLSDVLQAMPFKLQ